MIVFGRDLDIKKYLPDVLGIICATEFAFREKFKEIMIFNDKITSLDFEEEVFTENNPVCQTFRNAMVKTTKPKATVTLKKTYAKEKLEFMKTAKEVASY